MSTIYITKSGRFKAELLSDVVTREPTFSSGCIKTEFAKSCLKGV